MYPQNMKNYKNYKIKIRRTFFSLMRNFNNFNDINSNDIKNADDYAERIKDHFKNKSIDFILFQYMNYICSKLHNHENKDLLVLILIRTFDPKLELFKIYQLESTIKRIKMKSLITLGFFEPELIKYEKAYIKKFYDMDDYDFTKKLEI